MRVIDPGDIPGRTPPIVPYSTVRLESCFIDALPRQTRLMLDFVYAPVIDPVTGDPSPYTNQLITSVPFELPASDQQLQLSADIQLESVNGDNAAPYFIDSCVTQDILGVQVTAPHAPGPRAFPRGLRHHGRQRVQQRGLALRLGPRRRERRAAQAPAGLQRLRCHRRRAGCSRCCCAARWGCTTPSAGAWCCSSPEFYNSDGLWGPLLIDPEHPKRSP